jgi:hypothetical protein
MGTSIGQRGMAAAAGLVFSTLSIVDAAVIASPSTGGAVATLGPTIDRPAPVLWDELSNQRVGGKVGRFELDDQTLVPDLSAWYHAAAILGGDRLQAFEHNPPTGQAALSSIARAQDVAWHVAVGLTGSSREWFARVGETPAWARPRTGNADGPSGGLLYALADFDMLTPGSLAGDLRVVATGQVFSDGTVTSVRHVDAKLAAAQLINSHVFFTAEFPPDTSNVSDPAQSSTVPDLGRTIGEWLNIDGYEVAGRLAASQPDTLALVAVDDVRQALAWLCGRTQLSATCTVAHDAAAIPYTAARLVNQRPGRGDDVPVTGHPG